MTDEGMEAGAAAPASGRQAIGSLQEWCERTWPDLYQFIYRRVQNRQEAEDLTQESYLRALGHHGTDDAPPSPSYLRTIALNLIRDRWRRQRVRGVPVPLEEALLLRDEGDALDGALVRRALDGLPEDHRTVLWLRIVEGRSRAETARRMGRTADAVRGLQYRAVQAMRQRLREEVGDR